MDNQLGKVETILDLSHFEIGETITGSVYLPVETPVDGELEILVFKRSTSKEDEYLTNHSLNIVGDNLSKDVRKISFMIIPDEDWEGNEKIVIQTVAKKNDEYVLMDEVELNYG